MVGWWEILQETAEYQTVICSVEHGASTDSLTSIIEFQFLPLGDLRRDSCDICPECVITGVNLLLELRVASLDCIPFQSAKVTG